MGKKKRQDEPSFNNSDGSTESCDENQNMAVCSHIKRGIDLAKIKKVLQKIDFTLECEECQKNNLTELEMDTDYEVDLSVWMCLKCGYQGCGRAKNQHALKHFNTDRSDIHPLCLNTTIWTVWCYVCDNDVNITCRQQLLQCVEYIKKHSDSKKKNDENMPLVDDKVKDFKIIDKKLII